MSFNEETIFKNQTTDMYMKNSFRILILGAANTGKTSIVNWFLGRTFRESYVPTIEDFHTKMFKIRGDVYRIEILDTSGNDPFPAMKKLNIMIGDLFILLFSLDDLNSYQRMKQIAKQIIETKQQTKSKSSKYIPILILGNKLDYMTNNKITKKCVETSEVEKFLSSIKSSLYFEISCKETVGLENAFERFLHQWGLPIEMCPRKHIELDSSLDLMKQPFGRDDTKRSSKTMEPTQDDECNFKRSGSFKQAARKSFRRIGLRKYSEPCGAIMVNVRRPSIKTEMRMLELKTDKFSNIVIDNRKEARKSENLDKNFDQIKDTSKISNDNCVIL